MLDLHKEHLLAQREHCMRTLLALEQAYQQEKGKVAMIDTLITQLDATPPPSSDVNQGSETPPTKEGS